MTTIDALDCDSVQTKEMIDSLLETAGDDAWIDSMRVIVNYVHEIPGRFWGKNLETTHKTTEHEWFTRPNDPTDTELLERQKSRLQAFLAEEEPRAWIHIVGLLNSEFSSLGEEFRKILDLSVTSEKVQPLIALAREQIEQSLRAIERQKVSRLYKLAIFTAKNSAGFLKLSDIDITVVFSKKDNPNVPFTAHYKTLGKDPGSWSLIETP
jgi:hypothetical protein